MSKLFPIKLLSIILLIFVSCNQEEKKIYDYDYRCGDFYANGELVFHTYTFCSIVPIDFYDYYKKGYWEFYGAERKMIASANFNHKQVEVHDGGCPYTIIEVTTSDLKNYSEIHNDSIILSKIENCFSVELKNGKSKLLQEKKSAELINMNWNGLK